MLRGSYKNRKNRKKGNIQGKYKVLMLRGSHKTEKKGNIQYKYKVLRLRGSHKIT